LGKADEVAALGEQAKRASVLMSRQVASDSTVGV